jgi:hypothetical protein
LNQTTRNTIALEDKTQKKAENTYT